MGAQGFPKNRMWTVKKQIESYYALLGIILAKKLNFLRVGIFLLLEKTFLLFLMTMNRKFFYIHYQ